jgi:ZIP family zinc transporter
MEFPSVLLLALLPAAGNFVGGLIAEIKPASERTLSTALHAVAGIVIAVVGVELMPRALENAKPWIVVLAFCLGGAASILIKASVRRLQARTGGGTCG